METRSARRPAELRLAPAPQPRLERALKLTTAARVLDPGLYPVVLDDEERGDAIHAEPLGKLGMVLDDDPLEEKCLVVSQPLQNGGEEAVHPASRP